MFLPNTGVVYCSGTEVAVVALRLGVTSFGVQGSILRVHKVSGLQSTTCFPRFTCGLLRQQPSLN